MDLIDLNLIPEQTKISPPSDPTKKMKMSGIYLGQIIWSPEKDDILDIAANKTTFVALVKHKHACKHSQRCTILLSHDNLMLPRKFYCRFIGTFTGKICDDEKCNTFQALQN